MWLQLVYFRRSIIHIVCLYCVVIEYDDAFRGEGFLGVKTLDK